jgi:hypothetical protein
MLPYVDRDLLAKDRYLRYSIIAGEGEPPHQNQRLGSPPLLIQASRGRPAYKPPGKATPISTREGSRLRDHASVIAQSANHNSTSHVTMGGRFECLILLTIVISLPTLPFSAEVKIALFILRAYSSGLSFTRGHPGSLRYSLHT